MRVTADLTDHWIQEGGRPQFTNSLQDKNRAPHKQKQQ